MVMRATAVSPENHFGCIEPTAVRCCSRICSASFAIVCTTACAEPIVVTSAALSPAARHMLLASTPGPLRRFNLAHPKSLIL